MIPIESMETPRKFAIALVPFILALVACSAPQPTPPANPTATSAPAAETLSPAAPTESPSPALTPTPEGLQLEILEWYQWSPPPAFEGDTPETYVEVLVRNPYDYPVKVFDPKVRLLDRAGEIVQRSGDVFFNIAEDIGWGQILPGETVSVRFYASATPEWETFEFAIDLEEARPVAYTADLQIGMGNFIDGGNGSLYAQGTVSNTSDEDLRFIFVRAIVRDPAGRYVGMGITGVKGDFVDGRFTDLEPGQSFDLTLPVYLDPALANEPLRYEFSTIGLLAADQ